MAHGRISWVTEKCAAARDVIERVDWDCEVMKNYSDVNLGCGNRPASGISWVFEHVEDAIILEDDCVPHPSFFPFCAELLEKYRQDTRVMHIGRSYFLNDPIPASHSYYFSVFNIANGGWATWRRAWRYFDLQCKLWPILKDTRWIAHLEDDDRAGRFWARQFEMAYRKKVMSVTGTISGRLHAGPIAGCQFFQRKISHPISDFTRMRHTLLIRTTCGPISQPRRWNSL